MSVKIESYAIGKTVAEARENAKIAVSKMLASDLTGRFTWDTVEPQVYEDYGIDGGFTAEIVHVSQPYVYHGEEV